MVGPLLILATAWAGDCTINAELDQATDAILSLDLPAGSTALDAAKEGFGCGGVPSAELARYWLLQAAHAEFSGEPDRVEPALVAARVTDASVWLDSLGPDLKARWEAALPAEGTATLQLTDLPEGYVATLNGQSFTGTMTPGFHILQVDGGEQGFGKLVRASAGDSIELSTSLPPLPKPEPVAEPIAPPVPPRPEAPAERMVALHLAVGVTSVFGESYATEPSTKVGPALEVGLLLEPGESFWVRAAIAGELALGGNWAYADGEQTNGLAVSPSLFLAVGVRTGDLRFGALAGLQLPGRLPLRAVASYDFSEVVGVELRAGINFRRLTTGETPIEPAVSTHMTVRL